MLWAYVEPDGTVGQLHLEVLRLDLQWQAYNTYPTLRDVMVFFSSY